VAGDSLIRHGIIALHLATQQVGAEFYASCIQLRVGGNFPSLTDGQKASITLRLDEMQAGVLFLLTQDNSSIAATGTKITHLALTLDVHVARSTACTQPNISGMLRGSFDEQPPVLQGFAELVGRDSLKSLRHWRESSQDVIMLRLASSSDRHGRQIRKFVFVQLLELCVAQSDPALNRFGVTLLAAATKFHPVMTSLYLAPLVCDKIPSVGALKVGIRFGIVLAANVLPRCTVFDCI
jgi:hypothetical protein